MMIVSFNSVPSVPRCFSCEFLTSSYGVLSLLGCKKVYSLPGEHHVHVLFLTFEKQDRETSPLATSQRNFLGHCLNSHLQRRHEKPKSWWCSYYLSTWFIASLKENGPRWDLPAGDLRRLASPPGEGWGHFISRWAWCRKFLDGKLIRHRMKFYLGLCRCGLTPPGTLRRLTNRLVLRWRAGLLSGVSGDGLEGEKRAWCLGRSEPEGVPANYGTCQCSTTDKINSETQTVCRKPNTII